MSRAVAPSAWCFISPMLLNRHRSGSRWGDEKQPSETEELPMSKVATASRWKDELGCELLPGLKCDIEINIESGTTPEDINATTAWALREIAAQIEAGKLDTGFHPIKAQNGEKSGGIYVTHSATEPQ